jgi:hypothetical protein
MVFQLRNLPAASIVKGSANDRSIVGSSKLEPSLSESMRIG